MDPRTAPVDLRGFRALGRHGALGVVVEVAEANDGATDRHVLIVRGGVSDALTYFVPATRMLGVSAQDQTVCFDIDLTDFVPRLNDDGTVELRSND